MELQKFLNEHSDWYEILRKDPYNLIIQSKDGLVLFKYVQFESDFSIPLVCESRGIILEYKTWNAICIPFKKFFNVGEIYADSVDLNKSYVTEKIDGSLLKIFFYKDQWKIGTNGTINADDAETKIKGTTFRDLVHDTIDVNFLTSLLNPNFTYLFELIHPISRIVVDYGNKKELVLIGINDRKANNFDIFQSKMAKDLVQKIPEIRFPKIFNIDNNDITELQNIADKYNKSGMEFEGFVVSQVENGLVTARVKIKSPKYLKFHRLSTGQGVSVNLVQLLLDGEESEFESYLDQLPYYISNEYIKVKEKFYKLVDDISKLFAKYSLMAEKVDRKTLALDIIANAKKYSGLIFTHIDKDKSVLEILRELGAKKVKNLLD